MGSEEGVGVEEDFYQVVGEEFDEDKFFKVVKWRQFFRFLDQKFLGRVQRLDSGRDRGGDRRFLEIVIKSIFIFS